MADAHRPPPLALPLAPPFLPPGARPPALPPLPLLAFFFFLAFTWRGQHAEEAIYYVYIQESAKHLFYRRGLAKQPLVCWIKALWSWSARE